MLPSDPGALMTAHFLCRDAELQHVAASGDARDDTWIVVLDDDSAISVAAGGAVALTKTPGAQRLLDDAGTSVYIVPIPDRAMITRAIGDALEDVGRAVLAGSPALEAYADSSPEDLRAQRDEIASFVAGYAPVVRDAFGALLLGLLRQELATGVDAALAGGEDATGWSDDPMQGRADAERTGPASWREALAFLDAERAEEALPHPSDLTAPDAEALLESGAPAALLEDPALVEYAEGVWGVAAALYAALERVATGTEAPRRAPSAERTDTGGGPPG